MINNAVLLDRGIKCLTDGLGLLEAEQFIYVLLSQPFDYTEWRKTHLFTDMTVDEISNAADAYCKEN
jgi:ligand-binding SRPBCC domain-containing protein